MDYEFARDDKQQPYLKVKLTDEALIKNPLLNKGMAFSYAERVAFHLLGLIPPEEATISAQQERSYMAFKSKGSDLEKYIYLRDLQDSNETLFYSLITQHIEEMLPIVYTPTVGLGCQRFSQIYRRPRGIFIAYPYRDQIDAILANPRFDDVSLVVVTDGERILGLGDQGAGGMGISIGKLALYSACAGLFPAKTLPVLLDAGTNNAELRQDPLYIGWRHERIRDAQYDELVDAFVAGVKKRFKHVVLHWEDFAQINANKILARYRDTLCTFNDDIQGTAAVAAGTLFAAMRVTGLPLTAQRVVVVGAGSAGCGICHLLVEAITEEGSSKKTAYQQFYLVDREGLLMQDAPYLQAFQYPFARSQDDIANWGLSTKNIITLEEVIQHVKPTVLIGVSGQGGVFSEKIVRMMANAVERPIIFPLSNPTAKAEATPEDLMRWTNGRVIMGTGSPFPPIMKNGKLFRVDQTNNSYIFPGLGLGAIAMEATRMTDKMFMAAAHALATLSPALHDPAANLLPPLTAIRDVSLKVAVAVAKEVMNAGLTQIDTTTLRDDVAIEKYILQQMWVPDYLPYVFCEK